MKKIAALALLFALVSLPVWANPQIPNFPAGATPPNGSEQMLGYQSGKTVQFPGGMQSIGARMREAAQNAAQGNPAINNPWTVAGAWAISTSYAQGAVVLNSGNLYVQIFAACASLGSGSGPTGTNATLISDNTCEWAYDGQPATSASDAQAPSTSTASSTPFASSVNYFPALFPSAYKIYGATCSTFATNYWTCTTFNNKASNPTAYSYKICTEVTDAKFAVGWTNGVQPSSVIIDGRYYAPSAQVAVSGTPNWWIFDFTSTTGYRKRNVCMQTIKGPTTFAGIATTGAGFISYPSVPNEIKAAWVYDSYDAGSSSGPFASYGTLSQIVSNQLGWTTWGMGQGGTGPQNQGSNCSGACYNYLQRVQDTSNAATLATMDVILFNVSTNDAGLSGEQAAVTSLIQAIRADNPHALIIGIGPAPLNSTPTYAQTQALDTAGAAAFAAYTDPSSTGPGKACYIPFANSTYPPITGSFETGVNPTNANSIATIISSADNVHPIDLGTKAIARWLANQIATQCLPNVS